MSRSATNDSSGKAIGVGVAVLVAAGAAATKVLPAPLGAEDLFLAVGAIAVLGGMIYGTIAPPKRSKATFLSLLVGTIAAIGLYYATYYLIMSPPIAVLAGEVVLYCSGVFLSFLLVTWAGRLFSSRKA
jgi:hypothetical protein